MPLLTRLSTLAPLLLAALVVLGGGGLLLGVAGGTDARPLPGPQSSAAAAACPIPPVVEPNRVRAQLARAMTAPSSDPALDRQLSAEVETATFAVG